MTISNDPSASAATPKAEPAGPAWVQPVTLEGRVVRLEPLSREHFDGLAQAGLDPRVWTWMPLDVVTKADLLAIYETALANRDAGREQPLVTIERSTGRVIGSTRFMTIEPAHRRLEIGYTWLNPAMQKTAANSEAKLLMLTHAFEELGALRVEFKTDSTNEPSRNALLGIGAQFEGIFRRHMLVKDGRRRDSAYYSVTIDDWPQVRQNLQARVARLATDR